MKHALLILIIVIVSGCVSNKKNVSLWKTLPDPPPMKAADESGLAPVNDIKLYYAVFNKGGKEPVILLHGGLGNSDYWGFEVPLLSKTYEVIVVDSRGHGRSTMSDQPFSYKLMASDVLELMDYLKIKKASIVGWSDGGIIGLILAIYHPERVNKLFTFGTNFNQAGYKSEPADTAMAARYISRVQSEYHKLSPTPDSFPKTRNALWKMYSSEPDLKPAEIASGPSCRISSAPRTPP